MWEVDPADQLLGQRQQNEAYLAADPGRRYALYFTHGGSVQLDLSKYPGSFQLTWINIQNGQWGEKAELTGGKKVLIEAPSDGNWVAAIVREPT